MVCMVNSNKLIIEASNAGLSLCHYSHVNRFTRESFFIARNSIRYWIVLVDNLQFFIILLV